MGETRAFSCGLIFLYWAKVMNTCPILFLVYYRSISRAFPSSFPSIASIILHYMQVRTPPSSAHKTRFSHRPEGGEDERMEGKGGKGGNQTKIPYF